MAAYAQGQAYERLFQDHLMPGTCGIVLERERCRADFQTIASLRPDSADEAMGRWLASGDTWLAPKEWNGAFISDQTWSNDPITSWWYTAGIFSIAERSPRNPATESYLTSITDVLFKHASGAPSLYRNLDSARGLALALNSSVPPEMYPRVVFDAGSASYAQLGIYLSTLQELVDNPLALSRPESRAFGLAVLRKLQDVNATFGRSIAVADAEAVLSGDIPTDPAAINERLRTPLEAAGADMSWPEAQRQAFVLGALIAQVAYNAAVFKDVDTDRSFRRAIADLPPYQGISSDAVAAIKAMTTLKSGDWAAISTSATAATLAIAGQR